MKVYASRELCNELRKHETEEYARNRRYHRITIYSIILEKEFYIEREVDFIRDPPRACMWQSAGLLLTTRKAEMFQGRVFEEDCIKYNLSFVTNTCPTVT